MHLLSLLSLALWLSSVYSAPTLLGLIGPFSTQATTPESASALDALTPLANFAEQAYCSIDQVTSRSCGAPCDATPGVTVLASGGDGDETPQWYVAHDATSQSIIVAHQGTHPTNLLSVLNDLEVLPSPLNHTLFPQTSIAVLVHTGFQLAFERSIDAIDHAVISALQQYSLSSVQVTGHSLGAALGVLNGVHLAQVLPPSISVRTTVFGLPRMGNPAWATMVDATLSGPNPPLIHMSNKLDLFPNIPPQLLGWQHPQGEVYIEPESGDVVACAGEENINCASGNLLPLVIADHAGPYAGVLLGGHGCT
ncbi:alpha/beta-hydrolase [Calocera cornea HHB12733]|uniref:Alpha/beta-hydrolase n=1 Tax=Calocera cornea HHB12733 TaxID=1353952 RepID=A0A165FIZ2_9BASI|nr:alpha/beta-hydrolase [Calocera cornea HHB12733]